MDPDFEWRPLETSPVARVYRGHEQVRHYIDEYPSREQALAALGYNDTC
jgi:hypothetical protein